MKQIADFRTVLIILVAIIGIVNCLTGGTYLVEMIWIEMLGKGNLNNTPESVRVISFLGPIILMFILVLIDRKKYKP